MIEFTLGNLLESPAAALTNTVNTVGVMGKGIALQFKDAYPHNYQIYRKACKEGSFSVGQLLVVEDIDSHGVRTIVNFPTKQHWKAKSKMEYIDSGLAALREELLKEEITSIAIPPLGCGNGGLKWADVKPRIEAALGDLPTLVYVYEPNPDISKQLSQRTKSTDVKLTPARAMILSALFSYEEEGEPISLFVATKLAYFLQLLGGPFKRLHFKRSYYGPYATGMSHFIRTFNGSYLKGMEQMTARPFDYLPLNHQRQTELTAYSRKNLSAEEHQILKTITRFA